MARRRLLGRARRLGLRPPRRRSWSRSRATAGRRQHVARHRHQSAERDRGDAVGRGGVEDRWSANTEATTAADVFDAATLGGARALGRDDLGRIAPGRRRPTSSCGRRASWRMTPLRDPIKNIVYNATAEDIDRVYVDGRLVVDGGAVLAADERPILRRPAGRRRAHVAAHDEVRLGWSRRRPALAPDVPRARLIPVGAFAIRHTGAGRPRASLDRGFCGRRSARVGTRGPIESVTDRDSACAGLLGLRTFARSSSRARSARQTRSGVSGSSWRRTPVRRVSALPTAGLTGIEAALAGALGPERAGAVGVLDEVALERRAAGPRRAARGSRRRFAFSSWPPVVDHLLEQRVAEALHHRALVLRLAQQRVDARGRRRPPRRTARR